MKKKVNETSDAGGVQVFELTMHNSENQDELNGRLCKPGEANGSPNLKSEQPVPNPPVAETNGKKKGKL